MKRILEVGWIDWLGEELGKPTIDDPEWVRFVEDEARKAGLGKAREEVPF